MYSAKEKYELVLDGLKFASAFFEDRLGSPMIINAHHRVMQDALDLVLQGEINRLIINIPPGYTKTELAVINFVARGLAINNRARFLHLSYSDTLVLENSSAVKQIIQSERYQTHWPLELREDSKEKKKWWTKQGGGMYSVSAKGQVTGFRAGWMDHTKDNFTGALIIDDPVKPEDAYTVELEKVNKRFNETIKSRLAIEDVPIIVIQQRVAGNDLSGYLLNGGSGEKWYHLNLPVKISRDHVEKAYSHQIKLQHNLTPGWLWPFKHNDKHAVSLKAHRRTYWTQYMQAPEKVATEGALWSEKMVNRWRLPWLPDDISVVRAATAVDPSGQEDGKPRQKNDEVGIIAGFKDAKGHYYIVEDASLAGGPSDWASEVKGCYEDYECDLIVAEKNFGGGMVASVIRSVFSSDAIKVKLVTSSRGKILRAEPIAALYEQGLVHHIGFFNELEDELFTYDSTGKSPNRLDALVFLLTELSGGSGTIEEEFMGGMY